MSTVSVRVDEKTKRLMEMHDEINWSAVLRKDIERKVESLEERQVNWEKAREASRRIDELRESNKFRIKPSGTELIRKWRDSRR